MNLVPKRYLMILALAAGVAAPPSALAEAAYFGFSWGRLDNVPKPSLALKDANVTILLYRRDKLPDNEMRDTEIVLLDVCKTEGLQQISWVSNALSGEEATAKFAQIVAEGVRKYGESKHTSEGTVAWENRRVEAVSVAEPDGRHRILMVSRGPDFDSCAAEHDKTSDVALQARWLSRLNLPN